MRAPEAFDHIHKALAAGRRRLLGRATLVTAGWAIAAVGLTALAVVLLVGWGLHGPWWRRIAFACIAGVAAFVAWRHGWRVFRRYSTDPAVARFLEDADPAFQDGLIACVQFRREWAEGVETPPLVSALSESVAERLKTAQMPQLIPLQPVKRPWALALAAVAVWGMAFWVGPHVMRRGMNRLIGSAASHSGDTIESGPLVGDLTLTLSFPEHVGRPEQTIDNAVGDIEAPKGTRVRLKATTVEAATQASVRVGDAEVRLALSTDGREVSGEFVVLEDAKWGFTLDVVGGDHLVETVDRRIRIQADRPPQVELLLPAEDLELDDLRSVPVKWAASDDFGLSKVNVVIGLASDPDHAERLEQDGLPAKSARGDDDLDLSLVQAQAGDRLAIYVEAFDNNAVDGPQRTTSKTRYIIVHSPQEKHYALTEALRALVDVLINALAQRLEVEWHAPETPLPETVASVQASSQKAIDGLENVAKLMADDPLTPEEVRLALAGRLGAFERTLAAEKVLASAVEAKLEAHDKPATNRIQKASEANVEQLEQAVILVEALVARLALEDMAALTEEIQRAREELKSLIRAYKDNPSDQLKKRIMRDISRLRDRMKAIQERMAQLRQKLPEEFLNLDGLKKDEAAKGLEKSADQLDALEKLLEEGKIDEALSALDEMEKALDELSNSLDKDMQSLHEQSNPELQKAISELMDQTRDVMKQQQEVAKKTQEAADAEQKATQKILEEDLAAELKAVKDKAAELASETAKVNPQGLPSYAEDELAHLEQRVGDLQRALSHEQLIEALEMSERSLDHVEALKRFARHARPTAPKPGETSTPQRLEKGQKLAKEVTGDIAKLLEKAQKQQAKSRQPGSPQFQKNQQLAQQQQQVAKAAEALKKRVQGQAKSIPQLGEKGTQQAERAQQSMQQAGRQLGEQRPGQARPGQQQAMSELQNLMEGLKNSNKPKKAQRNSGRMNPRERVDIPDPAAPPGAAFRKDLLDAMKERPAEAYREQVKRYYESLVQ